MSRRKAPASPTRGKRPARPATTVPDILFCLSAAAFTMAAIFFITSFTNDEVLAGDAGRSLARAFGAALAISGLFSAGLGVGLLRGDRGRIDHYMFPIALGIVIGGAEAILFLTHQSRWLWVPFVLLIFAVRPIRSLFGRLTTAGGR